MAVHVWMCGLQFLFRARIKHLSALAADTCACVGGRAAVSRAVCRAVCCEWGCAQPCNLCASNVWAIAIALKLRTYIYLSMKKERKSYALGRELRKGMVRRSHPSIYMPLSRELAARLPRSGKRAQPHGLLESGLSG